MSEKKMLRGFEGLCYHTTAVVSVLFAVVSLHSPQNPLNFFDLRTNNTVRDELKPLLRCCISILADFSKFSII